MLRCCAIVLGIFFAMQVAPAAAQSGGRIIFFEGFNGRDSAFNGHRAMSGDGSTIRDLPEIPVTLLGHFTLNRDGSRVAIADLQGLFSANARFEERMKLAPGMRIHNMHFGPGQADWSPSGELLAYTGLSPTFNYPSDTSTRITLIPPGGGAPTVLPNTDGMNEPSWAPDERRIVVTQVVAGPTSTWKLVVLDRLAGTATTLFEESPNIRIARPSWSPDGSQIVYERWTVTAGPPAPELWTVGADGTGAQRLADGYMPQWSPDGQALAFLRADDANTSALYTIHSDGSGQRRLRRRRGVVPILAGWVSGDLAPLAPRLGKAVVAEATRGVVLVRRPGSRRFVELVGEGTIPVGSLVDTRRGAVRITAAADRRGGKQSGTFNDGTFKLLQAASAHPITDLRLVGRLERCRGSRGASAAALRGRRLWGHAKGRFRILGRRSAATVADAHWLVEDRCNGSTLTRVRSGRASVRDLVRRRTIVVSRGERYVAG
jgi:WD40 repeat protein